MGSLRQSLLALLLVAQCTAMRMSTWAWAGYRQTAVYKDGHIFMGNCDHLGSQWNFSSIYNAPPDIHNDSSISILYRTVNGNSTVLIYQANNGSIMMNQYTCDRGQLKDDLIYTDITDRAGIDNDDVLAPSSISAQISGAEGRISVYYQDKGANVKYIKGLLTDTTWQFMGTVSPVFAETGQVVSSNWEDDEFTAAYTVDDSIFLSQLNTSDGSWYVDALPMDSPDIYLSNNTINSVTLSLGNGWTFKDWNPSIGSLSLIMLVSWTPLLLYIGTNGSIQSYACNVKNAALDGQVDPYNPSNCGPADATSGWDTASVTEPWLNSFLDTSLLRYTFTYISVDGNLLYLELDDFWLNGEGYLQPMEGDEIVEIGSSSFTTYAFPSLPSATSTDTSASGTAVSVPLSDPNYTESDNSPLSKGAKIGIGIGVAAAAIGISAICTYIWFLRRKRRRASSSHVPTPHQPADGTGVPFLSNPASQDQGLAADAQKMPLQYPSDAMTPSPVYLDSCSPATISDLSSNGRFTQAFVAELPSEVMEDVPQELPAEPVSSPLSPQE